MAAVLSEMCVLKCLLLKPLDMFEQFKFVYMRPMMQIAKSLKYVDCPDYDLDLHFGPDEAYIRDFKTRWSSIIWWITVPETTTTGSKRGIGETRIFLQYIEKLWLLQISERPTKRFRQLGHQVHNKWPGACGSDFNSKNSTGEASKSCEENSNSQCTRHINAVRMLSSEDSKSFTSAIERKLCAVQGSRVIRRFSQKDKGQKSTATRWESLPNDLHENILQRVEFRDLLRFKTVSKSCKKFVESDAFRLSRLAISEGSFTAINYYIKNQAWRCSGYDLHSKSWRALPPFSYLPTPDPELFKEYSVCGHGGLMCAEVSKLPKKGELVVFNPLTGEKTALPPLIYPRNPVLVHIAVNSAQKSYKVVVAGSSTRSDEHLSRKMEVFDSSTSEWKETTDLPGPAFGLNEHQAGVYLNGTLFFVSFLEGDYRRGVVAFDVENGKWLENLACPIPHSPTSNTLQLIENDGKVYLFSEQELGASVEHCIDELEFPNPKAGVMACRWRNVVRVKKSGGRGLLVYPEHTCVGFGEGRLCIFNSLNRDGVVYDMRDGNKCEVLEAPPADQTGEGFFSLNPASFSLQPSLADLPGLSHTQENYVAKLADFGLTKCRPQTSYETTHMAGTTGWRAPEVFNLPDSDVALKNKWHSADVYSFGMLAFEILTGKLPFENEPNHSWHARIVAGLRPGFDNLRADFPDAVKELIQDCWATKPEARPDFDSIVKKLCECKVLAILPGFERTIMQTSGVSAH